MRISSVIAVFICALGMLLITQHFKFYKETGKIIESDAIHYYSYLPAILVYNDISLNFLNDESIGEYYFFTNVKLPDGRHYFKTTMGVALLEAPVIIPVHFFVKFTGGNANGISEPYKIGLIMSGILYFILGLLIIRRLLIRNKLPDVVIAITLLTIGAGTNIIVYTVREPGMSHIYSFFSIALFILLLDKFLKKPSMVLAIFTGIISGLILLIRPINIIVFLLFILWDVGTLDDIKTRLMFYLRRLKFTGLLIFGCILIWIPQLAYYYYLTGSVFFSGYGEETKFFFNNPQIFNHLFSYRKGWFLYTPAMVLAVAGFIPLFLKNKKQFWGILTVLVSLIYVNSSWYSWWFGGGFGQRAYIDIYALMAIPLAYFISIVWEKRVLLRITSTFVILMLISINLYQIYQYHMGSIHYVGMTREAYWYAIGRTKPGIKIDDLIEFPNYDLARKGIYPKPTVKTKTKKEWIPVIVNTFKKNPNAIAFFQEKADKQGISIDSVMYNDAIWTLETDISLVNERIIVSDQSSKLKKYMNKKLGLDKK